MEIHDVSYIKQGGRQDEDGDECYYVHINRTTNSTRRRHRYLFRRSITKLKIKIKKKQKQNSQKIQNKLSVRSGHTKLVSLYVQKSQRRIFYFIFSESKKEREREMSDTHTYHTYHTHREGSAYIM